MHQPILHRRTFIIYAQAASDATCWHNSQFFNKLKCYIIITISTFVIIFFVVIRSGHIELTPLHVCRASGRELFYLHRRDLNAVEVYTCENTIAFIDKVHVSIVEIWLVGVCLFLSWHTIHINNAFTRTARMSSQILMIHFGFKHMAFTFNIMIRKQFTKRDGCYKILYRYNGRYTNFISYTSGRILFEYNSIFVWLKCGF